MEEIKFETAFGFRSNRRSKLSSEKMRQLVSGAIKELEARKKKSQKLLESLKETKDPEKKLEIREEYARLRLPIKVNLLDLEKFFGENITDSKNIAWALNPKNPNTHFKDLVDTMIKGKVFVGEHGGRVKTDDGDIIKDKTQMSINFRLLG